ncbi:MULTISPECIES: ribonucleoside-diphosphate reductase subunit alpha [Xanthomonas translucens group]|uniref:Ribonucleoside-diphosphate reductase n=5 Tax=Xanthomonas translucens group TaxID=3390202 RepID=A0A0K2ZNI6_9XANT|nr:ribonucleoside-diphosphate reductase subunit alpha [Xanthomonas translucens]KTF40766.1 ribonucleotide-diphosphate reductase subunit alpha [Xanthomonas translucens pv. translucens]KWV13198.1 ribonucleotide-diphosphate reductase subunit alpha [Xanthomonas translucens]KWV13587.1 ribonucleotide-diphosphate reductase subunit alpha [Xanthomonas translucens]MCC8446433.1 ribonucleoside-diphosphate reductase subunit alpha [Xanthomonas translucens pv. translucens]MCS3358394.1 ribonucleoside-diphospha
MSQTHSLPAAAPLDTADVDPTPAAAAAAQPDAAASEPSNDQRAVTWIVKDGGNRRMAFDRSRLQRTLDRIHAEFPQLDVADYERKAFAFVEKKESLSADEMVDYLIREAESRVDIATPEWEYFAARLYLHRLYKRASKNRFYDAGEKYGSYVGLQESLADRGVYSIDILKNYSKDELAEAGKMIDPERDKLFAYNGLYLLATRYLATDNSRKVYELPQERWLTIALYLMQDEKPRERRMQLVGEAYWALSNLYMTVATPTLANAGKIGGQLSSCFIDTVDDSLQGIYDSNTDVARVSKHGGGVGAYLGYVRSSGSAIRGVKNSSGGVVPWIKQLNNTAVSVDQLGQRKGAIAVYLDIWHRDIEAFLDLRLNNGDQRLRAHDVFTAVCVPDIFMEAVERRGEWYLFDPHEVKEVKGWYLQDFFDEKRGEGTFRARYEEVVADERIGRKVVKAIDMLKRIMVSQLETGNPFMFYRDEVNRMNPNKHQGMVYSSNLCTEILQNMSPTRVIQEMISGDQIVTTKQAGDFVVCNLSSVNLGRAVTAQPDLLSPDVLERLIRVQVRMLDNVIDLNDLPVPQATITNQKYRAIGLGTFGWHHLLAQKGIEWNSRQAEDYCDELYERINYLTIQASLALAKEKGAYKVFKGSDWQNGEYFSKRGYDSAEWQELAAQVSINGVRNAWMIAVAPNMSTAQIAGSTASIDPIYSAFYYEEKKDFRRPVVAPGLNVDTYPYYEKGAYRVDQFASVRQNARRQRHVDQSISFNFYVPSTIRASTLLDLHMTAWKEGLKTTYYVRSNDIDISECEWCSS